MTINIKAAPRQKHTKIYASGGWASNTTPAEALLLMQEALIQAGIAGAPYAEFSRRCGCFCGCSPGFIVRDNGSRDVFVSLAKEGA
jgi:hypothetical protein